MIHVRPDGCRQQQPRTDHAPAASASMGADHHCCVRSGRRHRPNGPASCKLQISTLSCVLSVSEMVMPHAARRRDRNPARLTLGSQAHAPSPLCLQQLVVCRRRGREASTRGSVTRPKTGAALGRVLLSRLLSLIRSLRCELLVLSCTDRLSDSSTSVCDVWLSCHACPPASKATEP